MKRKKVIRLTACCIVGAMLTAGGGNFITEASTVTGLLPTAGIERALGESISVKSGSITLASASLTDNSDSGDEEADGVVRLHNKLTILHIVYQHNIKQLRLQRISSRKIVHIIQIVSILQ